MTPAIPSSELFRLQGQLIEMLAERDELYAQRQSLAMERPDNELDERYRDEAHEGISESIKALEDGIVSFLLERIRSVDDIRNPLLAMQAAQKMCEAEAQRATSQALRWQRQIETVLDLAKHCMKHLDSLGTWKPKESRKLQSALGSIMLVANGGKAPVEITDEALLPEDFKRIRVTMPLNLWMERGVSAFAGCEVGTTYAEPSKSAIEAELNRHCEHCGGNKFDPDGVTPYHCVECGGTGKRGVPGARLAERGEHVRISGLQK